MSRHIVAPDWIVRDYAFPADVQITECDDLGELPAEVIASAEFVVLPYEGSTISIEESIARMTNVKVIQT
ncbi:MAG: hypothetical protein RJB51_610, partial [Actinomycetota bacterium]